MAPYVYLLSDYKEDGSEGVVATLSREALPDLYGEHWGWHKNDRKQEVLTSLASALSLPDEELAKDRDEFDKGAFPHNLEKGWGGVQLHVVKLYGGA